MLQRKMRAPILPRLKDKLDTSNFDNFEEADLPPNAPGRTDKFTDRWEGLWDWIDDSTKDQSKRSKTDVNHELDCDV